jgi:hypothetical protein
MEVDQGANPERKIVKAKKRGVASAAEEPKMYDEDGNELEFEGEVEEPPVEEDVVQRDEDEDAWEDDDEGDDEGSGEDMMAEGAG